MVRRARSSHAADRANVALTAEQTEQLAHDILRAQHGDWPEDLAQARRMVRLATAQSDATELLVAIRLMELCAEAEVKQRNAGRL